MYVVIAETISALETIRIILFAVNVLLTVIISDILNVLSIGVDDGRKIESGTRLNMSDFKYILKRNRGSIFTQRDLSLFERIKYRFRGYKVIKVK